MTDMGGTAEFEALARRMWNVWSEAFAPVPATPAEEGMRAWRDGLAWWSRLAQGQANPMADASLGRFGGQAQQWFAQMQQLASGFAGQQPSAAQVAESWRRMLGGAAASPMADLLSAMQGGGLQDPARWFTSLKPLFDLQSLQGGFDPGVLQSMFAGLRAEGSDALSLPTFGVAREHQARWQAFAQAQVDHQAAQGAYAALLQQSTQAAFAHFERRLASRGEQGEPVATARALFDLWIDAAEEGYAEMALSRAFRAAYADLVNTQMRVRAGLQREVEEACASLGMPTRRELDGAHRKAAELERTVRRLRDAVAELQAGPVAPSSSGGAPTRRPTGARATASRAADLEARLQATRVPGAAHASSQADAGTAALDRKQAKKQRKAERKRAAAEAAPKATKTGKRAKAAKVEPLSRGGKPSKSSKPSKLEKSTKSTKSGMSAKAGKAPKPAKAGASEETGTTGKRAKSATRASTTTKPRAAAKPADARRAAKPQTRAAALVAAPARRRTAAVNPFAAFASIPHAPEPMDDAAVTAHRKGAS